MRILFMGTPDFALESLKALYEAKYDIIGVVTNIDKPKGRGMKMVASPVKEYAIEKNLQVYQPIKVRNNPEFLEEVKKLNPDLICVVAYGKILPQELLDIPKYGCVNVHGSLLPEYRGAAPIQWAVLNGDKKTGVTTMFMNAGMDTGDMILKEEVEIGDDETTGELWDRLKMIGANLLIKTVKEIENGTATRTKQPEEGTMAPMLSKEMAKIDWKNKTANDIKNLVRGLNPIMGAYTFLDGKKIKFWKVQTLTENELLEKFQELEEYKYHLNKMQAGTVLFSDDKKGLFIKANGGILQVLEIQGENSKRMAVGDFLRGNPVGVGNMFE
ncbi:MAG: methionyl-tRNA formyltransferase [Clostridium sp. CAG:245_30_32]|nr:MAG: methionyl-tRNA formyltransferase [Clostridium sp. CAG:245_30_32]